MRCWETGNHDYDNGDDDDNDDDNDDDDDNDNGNGHNSNSSGSNNEPATIEALLLLTCTVQVHVFAASLWICLSLSNIAQIYTHTNGTPICNKHMHEVSCKEIIHLPPLSKRIVFNFGDFLPPPIHFEKKDRHNLSSKHLRNKNGAKKCQKTFSKLLTFMHRHF